MAATEFHVATVLQHLRDVTGHDLAPCRVSFSHYRNGDFKRFERFFGCPVEFGAEADRLVLSEQSLNLPSLHADPHLFATLGRIADQEVRSRSVPPRTFREAVDNYLFRSLPRGEPTAEIVSQALTVSPRTLARRLADEGTSLSELLDDVRHGLAVKYVEQPEISIDQITALLGYAGAASFTHAFHRWTGSSPSAARRDRRAYEPKQATN